MEAAGYDLFTLIAKSLLYVVCLNYNLAANEMACLKLKFLA
jgi:hypothetical protein